MSGTLEFPTGGDGELTPALRDMYAPPAGEAYWDALEAKITARVGIAGAGGALPAAPQWWQVLGGWTRLGLAAAGLAALVAGAAALREREAELQESYEMVLEADPALKAPMAAVIPGPRDDRERERNRTLRDVLEY